MRVTETHLRQIIKQILVEELKVEQRYQKPAPYTPQGDGTTRAGGNPPVDAGATRNDPAVSPTDAGATRNDPVTQNSDVVPKNVLVNVQKQLNVLSQEINKILGSM